MFNHAPKDYVCPLCLLAKGEYKSPLVVVPNDILVKTSLTTSFISSRWWPNNKGHVVIIPNAHFENIYEIESQYLHEIVDVSQKISIAIKKAYGCDGITMRQHNEPAGSQDLDTPMTISSKLTRLKDGLTRKKEKFTRIN